MPPIFGGPISRTKAREHFDLFIKIKENAVPLIEPVLSRNDNTRSARRFYCGRADHNPLAEDLAFIFDKEAIQGLLLKLNNGQADGIIVFNGVRNVADSPAGTGEEDGRPTVMIFTYVYSNPVSKTTSSLLISTDDGTEHPGTGGKGSGPGNVPLNTNELPDVFQPHEIHMIP